MAKKIDGYIKLQIPAGQAKSKSAGRSRSGSKGCQHYGIL